MHFEPISNWVFTQFRGPVRVLTYAYLALRQGDSDLAKTSAPQIARVLGLGQRQVKRALAHFRQVGLVEKVPGGFCVKHDPPKKQYVQVSHGLLHHRSGLSAAERAWLLWVFAHAQRDVGRHKLIKLPGLRRFRSQTTRKTLREYLTRWEDRGILQRSGDAWLAVHPHDLDRLLNSDTQPTPVTRDPQGSDTRPTLGSDTRPTSAEPSDTVQSGERVSEQGAAEAARNPPPSEPQGNPPPRRGEGAGEKTEEKQRIERFIALLSPHLQAPFRSLLRLEPSLLFNSKIKDSRLAEAINSYFRLTFCSGDQLHRAIDKEFHGLQRSLSLFLHHKASGDHDKSNADRFLAAVDREVSETRRRMSERCRAVLRRVRARRNYCHTKLVEYCSSHDHVLGAQPPDVWFGSNFRLQYSDGIEAAISVWDQANRVFDLYQRPQFRGLITGSEGRRWRLDYLRTKKG